MKKKGKKFSDSFMRQLIVQLFQGLAFAHAKTILHRDMKPENILIMANWDLKLGDWGTAVQEIDVSKLDIETIEKTAKAGSGEGTPIYTAPEIIKINRYIYDMKLFNAKAARIGQEVQEVLTELYDTRKNRIPESEQIQVIEEVLL